jgi:hypothetical protein
MPRTTIVAFIRLAALGLALTSALAGAAGVAAARDDLETYASPHYGYTLTYDGAAWKQFQGDQDPDDPYDALYLTNGPSTVLVLGEPLYEADELDYCVVDYWSALASNDGVSDLDEYDGGNPDAAAGAAEGRAFATYAYAFTNEAGTATDRVDYVECRSLGSGVTLFILHRVSPAAYEGQVSAREDLLIGLQPGAGATPADGEGGGEAEPAKHRREVDAAEATDDDA